MVKGATPLAVNKNYTGYLSDWNFSVGFMWEGGGETYIVCLFSITALNLERKPYQIA